MRTLFFAFVLTLFTVAGFAQDKTAKINYIKEGYVKAKVIKYEVESCGFLIELADKKKTKLMPDNLADSFKKNNQKVWVKYTMAKRQMAGTCMAGTQVEITDIKKRK